MRLRSARQRLPHYAGGRDGSGRAATTALEGIDRAGRQTTAGRSAAFSAVMGACDGKKFGVTRIFVAVAIVRVKSMLFSRSGMRFSCSDAPRIGPMRIANGCDQILR